MLAKRRKVDDECRSFNEEWMEKYFSILHFGKPTCLICNQSVAVNKEFNIKRHYETKHSKFSEYRGQTRKDKISPILFNSYRADTVYVTCNFRLHHRKDLYQTK